MNCPSFIISKQSGKMSHKSNLTKRKSKRGQTLLEAIAGFLVIVPIGLGCFDLVAILSTTQSNEQWAELAARAAASQHNALNAKQAAEHALERCKLTSLIKSINIEKVNYDLGRGQVSVTTTMEVLMPVPMPYFGSIECHATAIQPIVATPAPI